MLALRGPIHGDKDHQKYCKQDTPRRRSNKREETAEQQLEEELHGARQ